MKITKTVTTEQEETVDILCNKCGNTCQLPGGPGFYGLIEKTVYGGYASETLEDFTAYKFSLCEKMLIRII